MNIKKETTMAVTEFGRAVRKARLATDDTLATMAKGIGKSVAFISAIETGRSKVPTDYVKLVQKFFRDKGYEFPESLWELASVDNRSVPIDHLDYQQQMMVAGFANSSFNSEELKRIGDFLTEIKQAKEASLNDGVK